jgi:hypothetical protein
MDWGYPTTEVVKTTSPTAVLSAPKALPFRTVPSSRTR